jgi:alpha-tubulin suppressor-like RCC1 family protein
VAAVAALAALASGLALLAAAPASAVTTSVPVVVSGTAPAWSAAAIAASDGSYDTGNSGCAVTTDAKVKCWGYNSYGGLGIGTTVDSPFPVDVTLNSTAYANPVPRVSQANGPTIAVSSSHACAIVDGTGTTGALQCWGRNDYGQLGDGTTANRSTPVLVRTIQSGNPLLTGVLEVSASTETSTYGTTCAIVDDGSPADGGPIWCWGQNYEGELGNGGTLGVLVAHPYAEQVVGITNATVIDVGDEQSCAVLATGTAKCWGNGGDGALGNGGTANSSTPVDVKVDASTTLTGVTTIAAGDAFACAGTSTGNVWCWGYGGNGQMGNGGTSSRSYAASAVTTSAGGNPLLDSVTAISAGGRSVCATSSNGRIRCWGYNNYGQVGDGTTTARTRATDVIDVDEASGTTRLFHGASTDASAALGVGGMSACARLASGAVACWGIGTYGGLGDGFNTTSGDPAFVNGTTSTQWAGASLSSGVSAGSYGTDHSCMVGTTGSAASCTVSVLPQQAGSYTIGASYTPSDSHTTSSGSTGLTVVANANPTLYLPSYPNAWSSPPQLTLGETIPAYGANCPAPSPTAGLFVTGFGGYATPHPFEASTASNGSWTWTPTIALDNGVGDGTATFTCSTGSVTSASDPAVTYAFPALTFSRAAPCCPAPVDRCWTPTRCPPSTTCRSSCPRSCASAAGSTRR